MSLTHKQWKDFGFHMAMTIDGTRRCKALWHPDYEHFASMPDNHAKPTVKLFLKLIHSGSARYDNWAVREVCEDTSCWGIDRDGYVFCLSGIKAKRNLDKHRVTHPIHYGDCVLVECKVSYNISGAKYTPCNSTLFLKNYGPPID